MRMMGVFKVEIRAVNGYALETLDGPKVVSPGQVERVVHTYCSDCFSEMIRGRPRSHDCQASEQWELKHRPEL